MGNTCKTIEGRWCPGTGREGKCEGWHVRRARLSEASWRVGSPSCPPWGARGSAEWGHLPGSGGDRWSFSRPGSAALMWVSACPAESITSWLSAFKASPGEEVGTCGHSQGWVSSDKGQHFTARSPEQMSPGKLWWERESWESAPHWKPRT